MKGYLCLILATLFSTAIRAEGVVDSLSMDQVEVTAIKQGLSLRHLPLTATVVNEVTIEREGIQSIKEAQYLVPNLFIPDYGSRITSSIYVRGLGARIDQPVVGLTVDNLPYLNKNAFDTNVVDIERIEFLRGPQSTLYGRNTMGGMINIYTIFPFSYQGVRLSVEVANGNSYRARATTYNKLSEKFALSVGGFYNSTDGLFTNEYNGELLDWEQEAGGRMRLQFRDLKGLSIDNTFSISNLEQGGYPYYSLEREEISYNDPTGYERLLIGNGLSVRKRYENVEFSSITGYQYLDDAMTLDNDFSPESYFTLTQAIEEHSVSQDFVVRSKKESRYNYLFGAFGFYKHQTMSAPVTFKEDGIENWIIDNTSVLIPDIAWLSDSFLLASDFLNKTYGAALYHESTLDLDKWSVTASLRGDYERSTLDYHSYTDAQYFANGADKDIIIDLADTPTQNFFVLLPKVALSYKLDPRNSLFASVSRGYKAGGFNNNIFSDILRSELTYSLIEENLDSYARPESSYDTEEMITYSPEFSWNYEVGAKLSTNDSSLVGEVAIFYIDCTDQQLTIFPSGSTGRMMANAGRSRSFGAEFSARATLGRVLLNTAYGYTNAKFLEYEYNSWTNYAGNYVPYAPQHTLYVSAIYSQPLKYKSLKSIDFEVSTNGAGKIYWNEENDFAQPFYATLASRITLYAEKFNLSVWGRNLTDKSYDTFYFLSDDKEFVQQAKPMTYGVTLNINL